LIKQKAKILQVEVEDDASYLMAKSSRMTARIAIRILKRAIDTAVVDRAEIINRNIVDRTLELLGIDESGLDQTDKKIIEIMYYNFDNKPVGLKNLAMSLSEDESTIEEVYEPYLIKCGYIKRTPKGRVLTSNGERLLIK
jgi:Holliday junction DNA helicase RuvB